MFNYLLKFLFEASFHHVSNKGYLLYLMSSTRISRSSNAKHIYCVGRTKLSVLKYDYESRWHLASIALVYYYVPLPYHF